MRGSWKRKRGHKDSKCFVLTMVQKKQLANDEEAPSVETKVSGRRASEAADKAGQK